MKRSLLDINVLIALLDSNHLFHSSAARWFGRHASDGWASCPITQNGCLRIMAHPAYPTVRPFLIIRGRLAEACSGPLHEFWPDDISLLEDSYVNAEKIHGSKQLTDLYLLSLAIQHEARFVTFDEAIQTEAVRGFQKQSLVVLSSF